MLHEQKLKNGGMMTEKRYDYSELKDGTYGVFKDKYHDDIDISFSQRFCIVENEEQARSIVGQLNSLVDESEQLKQDNDNLIHLLENQSIIIQELHLKLMHYQSKEPIALTKEDLEIMGKAISYYSHGGYVE